MRQSTPFKIGLALAKLAVLVLLVWGIRRTLTDAFAQIQDTSWTIRPGWLVLSGGMYLLGYLPAAVFWHRVMFTLGQRPSLWSSIRAHYVGQLGKYVPGKALVVVLRASLVRGPQVSATIAGLAVFIETLGMMAVGAILAASILGILATRGLGETWMLAMAAGLFLLAGIPTLPPVFRWLVRKFSLGRAPPETIKLFEQLSWRTLLGGWVMMGGGWLFLAVSLWAVLKSIAAPDVNLVGQLPIYLAAVTTSVVAGFLSLIPGGLGVRDVVLTAILSEAGLSSAVAVFASVLLRLVSLVAELGVSIILYAVPGGPARPLER